LLHSAHRLRPTLLLSASLAACSMNGATASIDPSQSGAPQNATLLRNAELARAFVAAPHSRARWSGWIAPDAKKKKSFIYWGSYNDNAIYIFSAGRVPTEKGEITAGVSNPERLFVDKSLNLYATNLATGTITAYKRGETSPYLTISDSVNRPTGLTVDSAGTVYCANVGNSTITEYPKGQTTPSLWIYVFPYSPENLAVDDHDNLYVSALSEVVEFAHGSTIGKRLDLDVRAPGALEVDKSGNIIIIDSSANTVDIFPAGQTEPSAKIAVTAGAPAALTLNRQETEVFASVDVPGGFIVQQLDYPNGTSLTTKISALDYGQWPIAVSPDAVL
jgi:hypothetical protein